LKLLGNVNFDRSTRIPDLFGSSLLTIAVAANGWSIYRAQRAQPVATGGKWDALENRSNRAIRNRWQPTATVSQRMVKVDHLLAKEGVASVAPQKRTRIASPEDSTVTVHLCVRWSGASVAAPRGRRRRRRSILNTCESDRAGG